MSRTFSGVGLPERDRRVDSATEGSTVTAGMMPISLSIARRCITSSFHASNIRGAKMPPGVPS
jgi:hypothetical protein